MLRNNDRLLFRDDTSHFLFAYFVTKRAETTQANILAVSNLLFADVHTSFENLQDDAMAITGSVSNLAYKFNFRHNLLIYFSLIILLFSKAGAKVLLFFDITK